MLLTVLFLAAARRSFKESVWRRQSLPFSVCEVPFPHSEAPFFVPLCGLSTGLRVLITPAHPHVTLEQSAEHPTAWAKLINASCGGHGCSPANTPQVEAAHLSPAKWARGTHTQEHAHTRELSLIYGCANTPDCMLAQSKSGACKRLHVDQREKF